MIRRLYDTALLLVFLWTGRRLFGFIAVKATADQSAVAAIHFARTERDMNNSARDYVADLDRPNPETEGEQT